MEIKDILILHIQTIREALILLDKSGLGTLFVIDGSDKLVGIVTDGDIRRGLLNEKSLNSIVSEVMNENFVSLSIEAQNSEILEQLNKRIKIVPLLHKDGKIGDYATINRLRRIMIASPLLGGKELANVSECIKTNWISSQGKFVRMFEKQFSDSHNNYYALAVSNGTVALHLALVALGIGEGDEVLVPDLTFAASINAILYTGATPVLVDIEEDTWNIDLIKAETLISKKTKAIMPVHLYGQPCDMNKLLDLSEEHNLIIVEDAAEALGARYNNQIVGSFGDASTFSFFGNKTITTGEGGMVLFKDKKIAEKAAMLRDHGMNKNKRYWHDEVGFNYRMTNLQASIGVAQFERLEHFIKAKRNIAKAYYSALSIFPFIQAPIEKENTFSSYWLYTILIKKEANFNREELMQYLESYGIETRPVFYPLHIMPPYVKYGNNEDLKVSAYVSDIGMSLPSAVNLSELEQEYICKKIVEFVDSKK